jgi:hypothetical protein
MNSLDIDDAFESYMHAVNPTVQRESAQYRESRRCFMAGMWQTLQHMMRVSSDLTESEAMREIAQLEDQLKQFNDRVKHDKD